MAAISVRDIPDDVWEQFKAAAQAEGLTAESRIRQWIIQKAREWGMQTDENRVVWQAQRLQRDDGEKVNGSLTFKIAVVQRDWEAVRHLAPQQRDGFHGTPALNAADWAYLRSEATKDGVEF